jgi:NhaC family Na+:H+ antiporter
MFDAIEFRGFSQLAVEDIAKYAGVPVYNGLTDEYHPTQMVADVMTMREHSDKPLHDIKYPHVLMGIPGSMHLSPEITAGAVISGAYFGDKASPLSDTANLATAAAGSDLFTHVRESLWRSVPALLLAVIGFALLGKPGDFDASTTLASIQNHVAVSAWNFLPLVVVLALALLRWPPIVAILIGALAGDLLAVVRNPDAVVAFAKAPELARPLAVVKGVWAALATGYRVETGDAAIDQLMSRGGMSSMMVTVWFIICALAFGAAVEHGGFMTRLINPLVRRARCVGSLVACSSRPASARTSSPRISTSPSYFPAASSVPSS